MNKIALYVVATIVGVVLLLFTCTYQVRFNETAIVVTFEEAREDSIKNQPGLKFKWPYPIQSVQKYDTRVRVLRTRLENVLTRDNQLVVVQVFLTWRIDNPLRFYKRLKSDQTAQTRLDERLRSAQGVFSEFDFADLLASNSQSNLDRVEQRMLEILTNPPDGNGVGVEYGIDPIHVGISRFILPEKTTTAVFERMKQTRRTKAAEARSRGEAEADRIRAEANAQAAIIREFAARRDALIRARGEKEAAEYVAVLSQDQELAVFLAALDTLEAIINVNTTLIIPNKWPFSLLSEAPTKGNGLAVGGALAAEDDEREAMRDE